VIALDQSDPDCASPGKQLALLKTNSAVRTCGFDFGGNIIMFSTDKQMGYQCFVSFFDLRDPSQIGEDRTEGLRWRVWFQIPGPDLSCSAQTATSPT
jgi:hypothetical protein